MTGMLSPYRVLDLTDGRAELATFVLAGMGADVIKIEPPGGAASRDAAPVLSDEPHGLSSLHFHAYNRGKRSVVLDLDDPAQREDFAALVAASDFVFENAGPGAMAARGLGFDDLRRWRPDLVYIAISPFGQTGPYAEHLATDLTIAAMGGVMALNGDRDRRPIRVTVPQTWHHAAAESALASLVAHHRRVATGDAQFVDVSVQAAMFWTGLNAMISAAIDGRNIERGGTMLQLSVSSTPLVYPAADGEVCLVPVGATLIGLIPWMGELGVVDDAWLAAEDWNTYEQRFLTGDTLTIPIEEVREKVRALTSRHTKEELFRAGLARGLTLMPVSTAADNVAMEQLELREYWDETVLPERAHPKGPGRVRQTQSDAVGMGSSCSSCRRAHRGRVGRGPRRRPSTSSRFGWSRRREAPSARRYQGR